MDVLRWAVGDASVFRIGEVDASPALDGLIREFDPDDVARANWLRPHFVDDAGRLRGLVQAFLIVSAGRTILVDPGLGNHKNRSVVPAWRDLDTDFLDRLRSTGVEPADVDFVVNTHLHFDHVGWNTTLIAGAWRPTFPRARYVVSAAEFRYWQGRPKREIADQHAGFADSVLPVYEAGLVDLVADDHAVTDGVRLLPAPGHTPHQVGVLIESGAQSALLAGDVMHHPCQIAYPGWGAVSDFDPDQARATRTQLVKRFADTETLVIGAHFADPVAGRIQSAGESYRLVP